MSHTTYNTTPGRLQSVPAFQFSVLTSVYGNATKIIYADGKEVGYSKPKYFYYKYCETDCLEDFAKCVLPWLFTESKRFIIRGQLKSSLDAKKPQRRLLKDHPKENASATIECPPRRWIVLDIDRAHVPGGLGAPNKMAEAAYHIRDQILPAQFRGVRCVASASAGTGRKGLSTAHMRMFFVLKEAVENDVLQFWLDGLSERHTFIDPAVMRAQQPIYTARPIFYGCDNPVPDWGRVKLLDGYEDELGFEPPRRQVKKVQASLSMPGDLRPPSTDLSQEYLDLTEQYAGRGVVPVEEISDRAWAAIKQVFDLFDGAPKNGKGRHETLNAGAWRLARLVAESELPEATAREAYWEASKGINNEDGKYDAALIQRHLDDAFADSAGCAAEGRHE
jgi:hypothetical protein